MEVFVFERVQSPWQWRFFGVRGHDRGLGRDDMSSRSKSGDLSPHSKKLRRALALAANLMPGVKFTI